MAGGDINDAYAVEVDGELLFVKTRADAERGEYEAEAAGLGWLGEGGAVPVPSVVAVGGASEPRFLALGWVEPGRLSEPGAEALGRGLAELHSRGAPAHLWLPGVEAGGPQRIGSVKLPSSPASSWPEAYADQRLRPLAGMAYDRGALAPSGVAAVGTVCDRIEKLAGPPEPPSRLHGDLWSGNVHADRDGRGWLIDPSAQGGHRELDLAMLRLFGSPSPRLIAAYEEASPLAAGHEERVGLWQLQPLLVHAVLFGGHYGRAAEAAASSYL